jgi:hypothetical protein
VRFEGLVRDKGTHREPAVLEEAQEIIVLPVDVTHNLDRVRRVSRVSRFSRVEMISRL